MNGLSMPSSDTTKGCGRPHNLESLLAPLLSPNMTYSPGFTLARFIGSVANASPASEGPFVGN